MVCTIFPQLTSVPFLAPMDLVTEALPQGVWDEDAFQTLPVTPPKTPEKPTRPKIFNKVLSSVSIDELQKMGKALYESQGYRHTKIPDSRECSALLASLSSLAWEAGAVTLDPRSIHPSPFQTIQIRKQTYLAKPYNAGQRYAMLLRMITEVSLEIQQEPFSCNFGAAFIPNQLHLRSMMREAGFQIHEQQYIQAIMMGIIKPSQRLHDYIKERFMDRYSESNHPISIMELSALFDIFYIESRRFYEQRMRVY